MLLDSQDGTIGHDKQDVIPAWISSSYTAPQTAYGESDTGRGKSACPPHSISQLGGLFSRILPAKALELDADGAFSRRRLFSKSNTFWAFFSQVLDADGGCQEVVRKVQAFAAARAMPAPSASRLPAVRHAANSSKAIWKRSSPTRRIACSNVAAANGGKTVGSSSWTAPE